MQLQIQLQAIAAWHDPKCACVCCAGPCRTAWVPVLYNYERTMWNIDLIMEHMYMCKFIDCHHNSGINSISCYMNMEWIMHISCIYCPRGTIGAVCPLAICYIINYIYNCMHAVDLKEELKLYQVTAPHAHWKWPWHDPAIILVIYAHKIKSY